MSVQLLTIGVNHYVPDGSNDLKGCVKDSQDVLALMKGGYGAAPTTQLLDSLQARRQPILGALERLVVRLGPKDVGVFHHSSHGTQVPDREGDELSDDMDEAICPADYQTAGVIVDDDIAKIVAKKHPKALLVLIIDACHSETMERGLAERGATSRPRFVRAGDAFDRPVFPRRARALLRRTLQARGFWGWMKRLFRAPVAEAAPVVEPGSGVVCLSACRADQTAADAFLDGEYRGAFTAFLVQSLTENGDQTYEELIADVNWRLKGNGFGQTATLSGDSAWFGKRVFENA